MAKLNNPLLQPLLRSFKLRVPRVEIIPVHGIARVRQGDDLASLILSAMKESGLVIRDGDIVTVTQKVVSKSEGGVIELARVKPRPRADRLGKALHKDARVVELILREARRVVRFGHDVIITETRHGFVCANSGVDQSNVEEGFATLLPVDPDGSARRIRRRIERACARKVAVVITDTFGRPWREGQVDMAIGCSGIAAISSLKGRRDPYGYTLKVTEPATVDAIAAASELVMSKLALVPVALVRGLRYARDERGIAALMRDRRLDLFR